jgi:hypothetical protein
MAERYDNSRRSASAGRRRPSPARAAATRARSRVADVPVTRKILMTLMVMGAMTTAVGAGTFASLTASTTNNTAVFSTGTLVLSDQVATGNTCFSNGTTPTDGGVGTATDVNDNANCDLIFDSVNDPTASNKRPGESTSVALHLQNAGTLLGTLSASSPIDCTDEDPLDQPVPGALGTGCDSVQLSIEDTANSVCYWGDNMGTSTTKPYITSAPLTYPVVIDSTNDYFRITVDGTLHDNITLDAGSYGSAALFAAEVHSEVSTWANVTAVGSAIRIESKTATGSSNVTLDIPGTNYSRTALTTMGFMEGSTAPGPGKCALKTGDRDHTLADFRTSTSVTPLSLGTIAASTTRDFTIRLGVPAVIDNNAQARLTNFALLWNLAS